jgi:UDP-glucose 4-epimerase
MKVLITGAAGFIGTHLSEYLISKGYEVYGVDNFSHHVKRGYEIKNLIKGDVCSIYEYAVGGIEYLAYPWPSDVDVVVHLAAHISVDYSIEAPWRSLYNNIVSTLNILEFCRLYDAKLCYASSCEIYGSNQFPDKPMDESHPIRPHSPYGYSKYIGELLCRGYFETYGLKVNILRPFNIFGPRQREDDYGGAIAKFTRRALNNQPPEIYGDGLQTRDYTYVDDIVRAYELAINADFKGEPINFGSGREVSVNELANLILELTGKTNLKPVHTKPRPNEVRRSWCNPRKAKEVLGWEAEIPLEEGLKRYIEWRVKVGEN